MAQTATPPSWRRRFSHPPLPTLPNIANFRAALLGYLGEVEVSLRADPGSLRPLRAGEDGFGASTAMPAQPGPSMGLRHRLGEPSGLVGDTNMSLLRHLSSLREDVVAYLPSRLSVPIPIPPGIGPSREWLRLLPSKLSVVDLGVTHADGESKVEAARRRVIELVYTLLPSEDWAGWESLGWEDEDQPPKSAALDGDNEDEDEEPEYLFPNRTAASANALASRRRAVRSKSVGSAWTIPPEPKLLRSRTEPPRDSWLNKPTFDSGRLVDDEDDLDAAEIIESPELGDTKLTPAVAPSNRGPTMSEALRRAEDGKRLIEYDDLPFVWRNNEHVITG